MNLYRNRITGEVYGDHLFAPFSGTVPYAYMVLPSTFSSAQRYWPHYWDHVTDGPGRKIYNGTSYFDYKNLWGSNSTFQGTYDKDHGSLEKRLGFPQREYKVLMIRSHEHLHVFVRVPFESDFIHCCDRYVGIARKDEEVFLDHSATGNVHWITGQKIDDGYKNACFARPGVAPMDAAVFYDDDNITPILRIAYRTVENDSLAGHSTDYEPQLGSTVTSSLTKKEYEVVEKDYSVYDESARKDGSYNVLASRWYKIRSKGTTTPSGPYCLSGNNREIPLSDMLTAKEEYIVTHIEGHEENKDIVVVEDIMLPKTFTRRNENTGLKNPSYNFEIENENLVKAWKINKNLRGSSHPDFNFPNNLFPVNIVKQIYDTKYPIHSLGRHISLSGDGMTISLMADQRKYYMKNEIVENASDFTNTIQGLTKELEVYNVDGKLKNEYTKNYRYGITWKGKDEVVHQLRTELAYNSQRQPYYTPQGKAIVLTDKLHIPDTPIDKDNPLLFQFKNNSYTSGTIEGIPVEDQLPTDGRGMDELSQVYHDLTKDHWRYRRIFQRFITYSLR